MLSLGGHSDDGREIGIRGILSAPLVIESCGSGAGANAAAALSQWSGEVLWIVDLERNTISYSNP